MVFICYGPHNNITLLMEYGFIIENNPYNSISIPLEIDFDQISKEKMNFLNINKLNNW